MAQKPKRPLKTLTIDQKIKLLNQIGKVIHCICEQYGVGKSTISDLKKQEAQLLAYKGKRKEWKQSDRQRY